MEIQIKKRQGQKHSIRYIREGLPDHWIEADDFLVLHDLCHYAIETSLSYKEAFWGMISRGIDPALFQDKQKRDQLFIADEAWYAEHMANLFLIEYSQGPFEDLNQTLSDTLQQTHPHLPVVRFSQEEINKIRTRVQELFHQWKHTPAGEWMKILFV